MKTLLVAALLTIACSFHSGPVTPEPDGQGDCTTSEANLAELECAEANGFRQKCEDAQRAEAKLGIVFPVGCITSAKSCTAARACK